MNIRELYPEYTESEAGEAKENLRRYIELSLQIYDRIRKDPEAYKKLQADLEKEKRDEAFNERWATSILSRGLVVRCSVFLERWFLSATGIKKEYRNRKIYYVGVMRC